MVSREAGVASSDTSHERRVNDVRLAPDQLASISTSRVVVHGNGTRGRRWHSIGRPSGIWTLRSTETEGCSRGKLIPFIISSSLVLGAGPQWSKSRLVLGILTIALARRFVLNIRLGSGIPGDDCGEQLLVLFAGHRRRSGRARTPVVLVPRYRWSASGLCGGNVCDVPKSRRCLAKNLLALGDFAPSLMLW